MFIFLLKEVVLVLVVVGTVSLTWIPRVRDGSPGSASNRLSDFDHLTPTGLENKGIR